MRVRSAFQSALPMQPSRARGDTNTYLGAHPDGGETFGGLFDDLRIFDQALTMKELQSVFEFTDSQLIARYGEEYEYQIESIKGPTEYNATGLPQGLEIDSNTGLIFGEANQTGTFSVNLRAANSSGEDFEQIDLIVLKGRQSILFEEDLGIIVYGDSPIDLSVQHDLRSRGFLRNSGRKRIGRPEWFDHDDQKARHGSPVGKAKRRLPLVCGRAIAIGVSNYEA